MKLFHPFFCFVFVLLLNQACKPDKETKNKNGWVVLNDTLLPKKSQGIIIKSIATDPKNLEYMNFINYSYFNGANFDGVLKENNQDTANFILEEINQPQIIEIFSFGDSLRYNTRIFVSPGDTILMSLNKKIAFIGKNAAQYNFYKELDATNDEWAKNKYNGSLKDYKNRCLKIYQRRQNFFEDYITNNLVSDDFISQVKAELKFEYLYNLIAPRAIAEESLGLNVNNPEFLELISEDFDVEKGGILDLKKYVESISINDFQRPELLNNDYFKRSLVSYIRYYFAGHEFLSYSVENFKTEQKYIESNLKGELKDYALTRLIYDYYKKGLGQGSNDHLLVKEFLQKQLSKISNPSYIEALNRIKEDLALSGFKLPVKVSLDQFTTTVNDTLTLSNILKNTKNKIRVLDFWAIWCAPCINEMKKTVELRNDLKASGDLEWVFISIDHNKNNWLKSLRVLKPFLSDEYQYSMLNIEKSELLQYLTKGERETFMIPRYVIIGPNDEVISSSAPRPSDSETFKNLINKIKN